MENQLLKKLKIKSDFKLNILNAPENLLHIICDVPTDVVISYNDSADFDALLIFAITKAELLNALGLYGKKITEQTICWICYPKAKTKLGTDLNLMQSWDSLSQYQLEPCASAAINDIWTSIRIKPAGTTKKSGVGNADIKTNDFGYYIDVVNKIVNLPEDFKAALEKNSSAISFYEQLSYSNRKEYVLWILTAKQNKTRLERIEKAVEKLSNGKKNPSEK